jgi:hypothetical protein
MLSTTFLTNLKNFEINSSNQAALFGSPSGSVL